MIESLEIGSFINEQLIPKVYKPITFLFDPSKRIYWGYLLTSLLFAIIFLVYGRRKDWVSYLRQNLFSTHIWLHPSSLLDIKLMVTKSLVKSFLFAPWLLSSYGLAIAVVRSANAIFGVAPTSSLSPLSITIIYTACLFVLSDFSRYLLHRLCHRVSFLWQFHQVHHSAEIMSPLTLYRSHPLEHLLFSIRSIVVTGLTTGVFFYLYKNQAIQYQLIGVNIFGLFFNMLGANLRHSHIWISYGPIIEKIFISPAQHQIHHSNHPTHHNKNYGSCLAIWDWLAGSLYLASKQSAIQFGLSKSESNHNPSSLASSIIGPFIACWKKAQFYLSKRIDT